MLLAGGVASVMARDVMAYIICACGELRRDNKITRAANSPCHLWCASGVVAMPGCSTEEIRRRSDGLAELPMPSR